MGMINRGLITVTGGAGSSGGSLSGFAGVTLLEGLSGVVDIDSPNGSISITTSGQVINFNALFTSSSGAIIDSIALDISLVSGLAQYTADNQTSLNGLSGSLTLNSVNDAIYISEDGQIIHLSGLFTSQSGALINTLSTNIETVSGITNNNHTDIITLSGLVNENTLDIVSLLFAINQNTSDIVDVSGLVDGLPKSQTSINGLSGVVNIEAGNSGIEVQIAGQSISLSALYTPASGAIVDQSLEDILVLADEVLANTNAVESLSGLTDGLIRSQTSVNGISGMATLSSNNNGISISEVGQDIQLTSLFVDASGSLIQSNLDSINQIVSDVTIVSGITDGLPRAQTTIEGLSGIVTMTSLNNGIDISVVGQDIQFTSLFVDASGSLIQNNLDSISQTISDLVVISGITDGLPRTQTSINGLSGIVSISSTNDGLTIAEVGQNIQLASLFTDTSGTLIRQLASDIVTVSGQVQNSSTSLDFTVASGTSFVMYHGLDSERFTWSMWTTDYTPNRVVLPNNIAPSGSNHLYIELSQAMNGYVAINRVN